MSQMDAIQKILSLPPDERSPLELLNITREQCDPAMIEAALARRLDRVNRHQEASTPDADTVRMALHTAAAQLVDPAVRSRILGEPIADEPIAEPDQSVASAPLVQPNAQAIPAGERSAQLRSLVAFRTTAFRTILLCGGWNRKSRRMLAAVAGASGIDPEHMAVALRSLSGTASPNSSASPSPSTTTPKPTASTLPRPTFFESLQAAQERPTGISSNIIFGVGGGIAALAIIAIISVRLLAPSSSTTDAAAMPSETGDPDSTSIAAEQDASSPRQRTDEPRFDPVDRSVTETSPNILEPPDPAGLVRTLRRCVELAQTEPGDAAWRLEQAVSQLSGAWTLLDPATVEAAQAAILVFLIEAPPGGERSMRALHSIAAGAKRQAGAGKLGAFEIAPAVWSCGALAEIIAAPGIREPVRDFANELLGSAVGEFEPSGSIGFADGALASLAAMASDLSMFEPGRDSLAAWGRWREALNAASNAIDGGGIDRRELETLDAIESLMRLGPSLAQRPDVYGEITAMLASLRWAPQSASGDATPARLALIRWFDDLSIETEDLALITEWIVRESATPGIGIQMILRRHAGVEGRAAQRDKYASVWNLGEGHGADELAVRWEQAATKAISGERQANVDIIGNLMLAAQHGRLNEAAARRWRREISAARIIMDNPFALIENAAAPRSRDTTLEGTNSRRDGAWSTEFLGASNAADQKLAAISRLDVWGREVGPIDGDVLARAALLGSPHEVRIAAQRAVRKRASEPAVINGLLESISIAPKNDSTLALIETVTNTALPSPRSPAWPRASRLALAERLLEMLASRSGLSAMDRIAATIASSYRSRAGDGNSSGASTNSAADRIARSLWHIWRSEADQIVTAPRAVRSLETIDRRRKGRLALASGPMQRFAAEQSSIAEVMGFTIASERPSRTRDINAVLDQLASERRGAAMIFEQIESAERAMLSLWMIRFGESLPDSIGANPLRESEQDTTEGGS